MTKTRAAQTGPLTGLIAQVVLLTVLAATAGLGTAGWTVGIACAVTIAAALAHGLARVPGKRLGPASWVTLARATLAVGVAALAADWTSSTDGWRGAPRRRPRSARASTARSTRS